jgi:NADP+-dependent farnesol dehydrogenase
MINNAGLAAKSSLLAREGVDGLRQTINVNILGLVLCTREAYLSMKKHEINDGHVIHINSVFGHKIPFTPAPGDFNIYPATKYAVTALTESHRQDFLKANTKIKVTVIFQKLSAFISFSHNLNYRAFHLAWLKVKQL